uniref:Uncharacterized protein n=1 Tax=Xiphophorus couchianus TaxID=32473 RepID=A0A3B5KX04_9TELE
MWLLLPSTRADMTFPRAETPVFVCLSLPAKSTRFSLPTLMWFSPSTPNSLHSTLCSFMFVEPTERFWLPTFITCSISRALLVTNDESRRPSVARFTPTSPPRLSYSDESNQKVKPK